MKYTEITSDRTINSKYLDYNTLNNTSHSFYEG